MARPDRLTKLIALFDQFHTAIAQLDEPSAKRLVENWASARDLYVAAAVAPRSALATGMEQGLRETPLLLSAMPSKSRKFAADALTAATVAHYPEFLAGESARIEKITARGSIRSKREFYLVRHHVDVLEGAPGREAELQHLCELVDRYEARGA